MLSPDLPRGTDYFTKYGAGVLAEAIERYWRDRGYFGIVAKRHLIDGMAATYGVRSNIGPSGFPPRIATKLKDVAGA